MALSTCIYGTTHTHTMFSYQLVDETSPSPVPPFTGLQLLMELSFQTLPQLGSTKVGRHM